MRVIFDRFRGFIPGNDGFVKVYALFYLFGILL